MDKESKGQGRKCFIITPIGEEGSDTFIKASGVIDSVIKPVLSEYSFDDIKPAYEINKSGMINTQIINRIINDDLVIANLTGNNPNVMYELCIRHVVAKPIIQICEKNTDLPFDIKDSRTIFYEDNMHAVPELRKNLENFISYIDFNEESRENPVYTAVQYGNLLKEAVEPKENEQLNILLEILSGTNEIMNEINKVYRQQELVSLLNYDFRIDVRKIDYNEIDMDMAMELFKEPPIVNPTVGTLSSGLKINEDTLLFIAISAGVILKNSSFVIERDELKKILYYICNIM